MNTVSIAMRNLNRQKKRSFLLGGAIAFGIFIITMINGFTGSFVENVSENFSHLFAGHIFIDGVEKTESGKTISIIRDDTKVLQAIRHSGIGIKYITRRSIFSGTLFFEGESLRQNITGVDWDEAAYFKERIVLDEGSFDAMENPKGLILSTETAEKLNVEVGDSMLVQLRTVTGQQNVGEFILAAKSRDPGLFGSISAYANIEQVNRLLNIEDNEYITMGIFLPDLKQMNIAAVRLYQALAPEVNMFDRIGKEEDRNFFAAMMDQTREETWEGTRFRLYTLNDMLGQVEQMVQVLNIAGMVILVVLFVIIMVGITNTFRMIMFERTREIGTMRALGMHRRSVRRLFIMEALLLSLGGVAVGMALTGLTMLILSRISMGVDSPIYILLKNGRFSFSVQAVQVTGNTLLIAAMTMLASFFPARTASRMEPADALRFRN